MKPVDINNFESICVELLNNNNVGVEYEFSLYYLLLDNEFQNIFNK